MKSVQDIAAALGTIIGTALDRIGMVKAGDKMVFPQWYLACSIDEGRGSKRRPYAWRPRNARVFLDEDDTLPFDCETFPLGATSEDAERRADALIAAASKLRQVIVTSPTSWTLIVDLKSKGHENDRLEGGKIACCGPDPGLPDAPPEDDEGNGGEGDGTDSAPKPRLSKKLAEMMPATPQTASSESKESAATATAAGVVAAEGQRSAHVIAKAAFLLVGEVVQTSNDNAREAGVGQAARGQVEYLTAKNEELRQEVLKNDRWNRFFESVEKVGMKVAERPDLADLIDKAGDKFVSLLERLERIRRRSGEQPVDEGKKT